MNKIFITSSGSIGINAENDSYFPINPAREAISRIYKIDEESTIIYNKGDVEKTIVAPAGSIVVVFYDDIFVNKVITVNNDEWFENLTVYEEYEQKMKEEWAAKKSECCDECCENCDKPIG